MTRCKLNYNALNFNNYGCWCGIGGSNLPIDGIDRCCMIHDKCYDNAVQEGNCFLQLFTYVIYYDWICDNKKITCNDGLIGCSKEICDCDKELVDCWSMYQLPEKTLPCNH